MDCLLCTFTRWKKQGWRYCKNTLDGNNGASNGTYNPNKIVMLISVENQVITTPPRIDNNDEEGDNNNTEGMKKNQVMGKPNKKKKDKPD